MKNTGLIGALVIGLFWAAGLSLAGDETIDFHQESPGLLPQPFAPGILSVPDRYEQGITFTPDGNECYFTVSKSDWSASWIMKSEYRDGAWTTPVRASFSNERSVCASISPDGSQLFFSCNRGTEGKQGIWVCQRTEAGLWSEPKEMNRSVSSTANEWSCHLSDKGNIFVCSWRPGGQGRCDGWRIPCREGHYQNAENLTPNNTENDDCGAAPGPEERYVIFSRHPGEVGLVDLYISYALEDGTWSTGQNLGPTINSKGADGGAWISFDGRYLFFTSNRGGDPDIYWVETRAFLLDPDEVKTLKEADDDAKD